MRPVETCVIHEPNDSCMSSSSPTQTPALLLKHDLICIVIETTPDNISKRTTHMCKQA